MIESSVSLGKVRFVQKGVFDINKVQREIQGWMDDRLYDYTERENTEKTVRNGLLESVIKIFGDRKVSDYVIFEINADIGTFEMRRKGKLQEGTMVVKMTARVALDYKGKWQETKKLSFLQFIYNNFILKAKIRSYVVKLDTEFSELQDIVRESMGLYS